MVDRKELAKFASGITAWEAIVHLALGLSNVLPLTLFGITITPSMNTIQIIVPGAVSIILAHYAWFKK